MNKTITTKEGARLLKSESREHGPDNNLLHYYNSTETEELYLTVSEWEDFELESGMHTDSADIQTDEYFAALLKHLIEEAKI